MNDTDRDPRHFSLTLRSDFAVLERVLEETDAFLHRFLDDEDLIYRVVLLTTEAVTNAIEHGNGLNPEKTVWLDVRVEASRITLSVEDEGRGFDPERVEDPLAGENLFAASGRGVYLIETMADEVRFEKDGRRVCIYFHVGT